MTIHGVLSREPQPGQLLPDARLAEPGQRDLAASASPRLRGLAGVGDGRHNGYILMGSLGIFLFISSLFMLGHSHNHISALHFTLLCRALHIVAHQTLKTIFPVIVAST